MPDKAEEKDEGQYIFRAWITLKNGVRLYAKQCGIKAFKIPVSTEE